MKDYYIVKQMVEYEDTPDIVMVGLMRYSSEKEQEDPRERVKFAMATMGIPAEAQNLPQFEGLTDLIELAKKAQRRGTETNYDLTLNMHKRDLGGISIDTVVTVTLEIGGPSD